MVKWLIGIGLGLGIYFLIGLLTGKREYGGTGDELSKYVRQKAAVDSWIILILFFIINFVYDYFNLFDPRVAVLIYPELFYLIIAIVAYFISYFTQWHRLKKDEK